MPGWFYQGGPVMYLLLACSVIAVMIIVERLIFWIRERRTSNIEELDSFITLVHDGQIEKARELARQTDSQLLQSMVKALGHSQDPRMHALHEALELELDKAMDRTNSFLSGLDTIATLTPLLGIFGTVIGIIESFQVIGTMSVPDPQAVGVGLAEALITTAAGLAVAMPALIFHNFFLSMGDRHVARLEKYVKEFEIHSSELEIEDPVGEEAR